MKSNGCQTRDVCRLGLRGYSVDTCVQKEGELMDTATGKLLLHTPNLAFITFSYPKLLNHTPFFGEGYDSVVWGMKM